MRKRFLLFLFLILIIFGLSYVAFVMYPKEILTVKEFKNLQQEKKEEEQEIVGKITDISYDYFTIVDAEFPENSVSYYFVPDEFDSSEYAIGDIVLTRGTHEKINSQRYLTNIEKIDRKYIERYNMRRKPFLKISVLEYPKNITNICEDIVFILEFKNASDITVNYSDLYNELFGYSLIYKINGNNYLYHLLEDFGSIKPGEVKQVKFYSTANTNTQMLLGENSVQFAWGQKSLYDVEFLPLSSSQIINFNVENKDCE